MSSNTSLFETAFLENIEHKYAIWHFTRYKRIADIINDTEGKQVLDVGCGIALLDLLITNKDIVSMDISREDLKEAVRIRKNSKLKETTFHTLVADLHALPFKDKFDVIICSEVLEHLTDDRRALAALLSILEEKGLLLITLPNALRLEFPQLFRFALRPKSMQKGHIREYKVNDVQDLMKSFPLRVERLTGVYFDFPFFHVFNLPIPIQVNLNFSTTFRFFVYAAFYSLYATFWTVLEKLFWTHAYFILVALRKSYHQQNIH